MALDTRALRALGWCDPPTQIKLVPGEVQLWLIRVPEANSEVDRLIARLTPAERERAKAKRIANKRHEYIAGQASLRTLLARQLDIDPMLVEYARGPKGKPYLNETVHSGSPRVQFNITHSGAMLMVAMALDAELGVDVLLIGSIEQVGAQIHGEIALVDAKEGLQYWVQEFEELAQDAQAVQQKIALSVATELKGTLNPEDETSLRQRETQSDQAYEFYLKGEMGLHSRQLRIEGGC